MMGSGVPEFGVALPQVFVEGDPVDVGMIREFAVSAERRGFTSLWVMETGARPGKVTVQLEPLSLLAHVAAITRTPRIGTSVLLPGLRHPIRLAKVAATIDHLSAGRLVLGVGVGDAERAAAFGIPREEWIGRFEEGLEVMQALWRPGRTDFTGRYWSFTDLGVEPKPVQRPHPPIWFGAHAPAALRRAARLGSGWMGAGSSSSDDFVTQRAILLDALERQGDDEERFSISKRVYVAVDDDTARAERRSRDFFGAHYRNPDNGSRCAVYGPAERCAEELMRLRDAGARLLMLNTMFDHLEQLDALAVEVLPLVR
jgi:probable F420-dependent oxidoreductase